MDFLRFTSFNVKTLLDKKSKKILLLSIYWSKRLACVLLARGHLRSPRCRAFRSSETWAVGIYSTDWYISIEWADLNDRACERARPSECWTHLAGSRQRWTNTWKLGQIRNFREKPDTVKWPDRHSFLTWSRLIWAALRCGKCICEQARGYSRAKRAVLV